MNFYSVANYSVETLCSPDNEKQWNAMKNINAIEKSNSWYSRLEEVTGNDSMVCGDGLWVKQEKYKLIFPFPCSLHFHSIISLREATFVIHTFLPADVLCHTEWALNKKGPSKIMDIIKLLSPLLHFRCLRELHIITSQTREEEKLYKSFIAYIIFNHPIDFPPSWVSPAISEQTAPNKRNKREAKWNINNIEARGEN